MANFEIELIHEPSGQTLEFEMDFDTDDPEAIVNGNWPDYFVKWIFDDISIVPFSYEED